MQKIIENTGKKKSNNMIELNKVYCDNCLSIMKKMEDCFVDLTVTSPPYSDLRKYNGYSFDFEKIAKELYRITKNGGVLVWVVADKTSEGSESGDSFRQALFFKEIGFKLWDTMLYAKLNPPPNARNRYQQCFEYMFVFSKGKPNTINLLLRDRRNLCNDKRTYRKKPFSRNKNGEFNLRDYYVKERVPKDNIWWYYVGGGNSTKDKIAYKHPAIFPEQLAQDHINSWSKEKDLVFDPFAGSGTTLKMAKLLNRNWIGSEISEEYCKIIRSRIGSIEQDIFKD